MAQMTSFARSVFGAVAALLILGSLPSRAADPTADPEIAKLVPADIKATGVLSIGTDATYAPFESVDPESHDIVGFDADLGRAIAATMGLKANLVNTPFDNLIPALASGKLAMAMSSIGDTKEREGVVDFVTYYWNSTNLLVPASNAKTLGTDHLCGAKIAVIRGSLQQTTILPSLMTNCGGQDPSLAAGNVFKSSTDAVLALHSGRVDGLLSDAVANDNAAETSEGQLKTVGPLLRNKSPGGVAIRKESGLQGAVLAAVKKLMADGTYAAALQRWHLEPIKIDAPVLNWAAQQK
jgi:polar amino acid transport system substrate-binding protein